MIVNKLQVKNKHNDISMEMYLQYHFESCICHMNTIIIQSYVSTIEMLSKHSKLKCNLEPW